jgi:hypothetical protein
MLSKSQKEFLKKNQIKRQEEIQKSNILNNIKQKQNNIIPFNKKTKQQIINKYINNKSVRFKISSYNTPISEEPIIEEPIIDICNLVDTDFGGECDYYGNLYLLGPYAILENFETRADGDIGGEMFNVSPFKYEEDFESVEPKGVIYDMTQNPPSIGEIL